MVETVSSVTIDLHAQTKRGTAQIVFRCDHDDRDLVGHAAHRVGLRVSEFMRLVIIQSAKQIMAETVIVRTQDIVRGELIQQDDYFDPLLPPGAKR